ncbi:hypothetical protein [Brucella anthropi]|uniref:hypothetical protein n=1 Tax=Brucella anthropi TaxID=529 RepID=UPI00124CDE25|nr:hypothetical protein [Brucella anthropi]KAB2728632.1 hypothetical protein F9K76_04130 [Brucella anthropi]KAB2745805.1 hypothetical protein F9K74_04080 [Brucella anthropi]KAB2806230.1 hypothetical protein F9K83_04080 [Brucella anthropi]
MIPFSEYFQTLRDWLDLNAQVEMAYWARWTVIVSTIALLASIAAVWAAFSTLRTTRKLGQQQNQAYLYASSMKYGAFENVIVECHNTGLTPATHFSLNATARIVKRGNVTASIHFNDDDFKTWTALGADQKLTASILDDDETVKRFRSGPKNKDDILLVCGQIVYCTVFNEDHLTQFAFFVDHTISDRFRRPVANLIAFHKIGKPRARERILGPIGFHKSK